ncbi:DUF4232 domain-containing protein [Streptomyces galbus]|uniref:DUF4232 domain-containing protein n=1 Tax=Streptomyces galbus TaxID=33898 RepID=A0A4U5WVI4_STRGB|nr:DUF4232 domain-containing protein [Streptomyces galbus]TKT06240.1 DUF4232 domain-containing protein [Streptomyces galbus]GHD47211.1 hypothetical protein GCM10010335_54610 [Streptomyces galbus]
MRAVPITVTTLAAALLLTACDSGGDSGNDDAKPPATPSAAASGGCAADGLDAQVGPVSEAPAAGDTGTVTVTLTNKGAECTLKGFPVVRLHADADVDVPQDPTAPAQSVTLPEQGTASFTITYVRGDGGKSVAATTASYALPNGTGAPVDFDWSYGDVARKDDGAVDATVSGFQQAGD